MKFRPHARSLVGAGLTILCGVLVWGTPLGERWKNASYDYLFRFGARTVTNNVVLIQMDNESYYFHQQPRNAPWDRRLHAALLRRLAEDGCRMVVLDVFFAQPGDSHVDEELADALRRQPAVVLMAKVGGLELQYQTRPALNADVARPLLPAEPFLSAARQQWGVAWLDPDQDLVVRRHWPFPEPGPAGMPSLPRVAAELLGARLSAEPQERWLRYYAGLDAWDTISYRLALTQTTNFFRDKIVFVGSAPQSTLPSDGEIDKVSTPFTRWNGEAVGGVKILATAFLNLTNGDWLRRLDGAVELLLIVVSGGALGAAFCLVRPVRAGVLAGMVGLSVVIAAVWFSQVSNYWFPWLVIGAGQLPVALVWGLAMQRAEAAKQGQTTVIAPTRATDGKLLPLPEAPDYELLNPPFGEGAFGRVWLARNAIGQWQALKAVYAAQFKTNLRPYDREFSGIRRYKPVSDKHPGLLRVDFVSKQKRDGYFYYVMELGDALQPGWQQNPATYVPKDLARVRGLCEGRRLPAGECIRIGLSLAKALHFLHEQSLTHGDIKPQNIIFVNGQPKLADVGLVDEVLLPGEERTWMGTPGYMPPPPEPPGTPEADIYALGMVLYVSFTGEEPGMFPSVPTRVVDGSDATEFMRLNAVILKACDPDRGKRYASASELAASLRELQPDMVQTSAGLV